jgi:hypothetical protein
VVDDWVLQGDGAEFYFGAGIKFLDAAAETKVCIDGGSWAMPGAAGEELKGEPMVFWVKQQACPT